MADTNNSWVESYLEALVSWPSSLSSHDPSVDEHRSASSLFGRLSFITTMLDQRRMMQLTSRCADCLLTVSRLHVRLCNNSSGVCIMAAPRQTHADERMVAIRAVSLGMSPRTAVSTCGRAQLGLSSRLLRRAGPTCASACESIHTILVAVWSAELLPRAEAPAMRGFGMRWEAGNGL
jgi:hypothetical protein